MDNKLRDTPVTPFYTYVKITAPDGLKYEFVANMTCSESQETDTFDKDSNNDSWMRTTWSLDG